MTETEVPLPTRPAATVMLVRDAPGGLKVFLMRRHSKMEFAPGVMVFPGGGVDDRDRNADIAWAGPPPQWWAQRFGIEPDLAEALVCAAARETFEESGVLFAGPAGDPDGIVGDASVYRDSRRALAEGSLSFADFLRRENLELRSDLLRPWANWVTPEAERTRRYDTYFFVGALPEGQRADGENTESDHALRFPLITGAVGIAAGFADSNALAKSFTEAKREAGSFDSARKIAFSISANWTV